MSAQRGHLGRWLYWSLWEPHDGFWLIVGGLSLHVFWWTRGYRRWPIYVRVLADTPERDE